jgi:hypothetical protein
MSSAPIDLWPEEGRCDHSVTGDAAKRDIHDTIAALQWSAESVGRGGDRWGDG